MNGNLFNKKDVRCPVCQEEWNMKDFMKLGVIGCPFCKTRLEAMKIAQDGYFKLNWQDARVLIIYALRWSSQFDVSKKGNVDAIIALENIITNLHKYKPKDGLPVRNIEIIVQKKERDSHLVVEKVVEKKEGSLKPNKEGKILSPFYQIGKPPKQQ